MTQIALAQWGSKVMRGRYQEQLQAFFKVDKRKGRFRALWPPKKLILRVLFISEGYEMKEKARGSSFEVSETRYIANYNNIMPVPLILVNFIWLIKMSRHY